MLITQFTKLAVAGVVATLVAGGAALAVTGGSDSGPKQRAAEKANRAAERVDGIAAPEGGVGVGAGTDAAGSSTSADGSTSDSGTAAGASTGAGGTSAGTRAGTSGGSIGGGKLPGQTPTAPELGGAPGVPGVDTPTPPAVPNVDVPSFNEGSYTVPVPGTSAVTKQLCLNGEVDRCREITVPALKPVSLTVSYSANASTAPPTFGVEQCAGGLVVNVAGITPGTSVSVRANGLGVSRTVGPRETSQSASLCD